MYEYSMPCIQLLALMAQIVGKGVVVIFHSYIYALPFRILKSEA
jgi:hypothetical protein